MSHHPSLPGPTTAPPNPSFSAWLRGNALLFIGQIFGVTYSIASLIYYLAGALEQTKHLEDLNRHLLLLFDWAHLLFIFLFICCLIYVLDDNDRGRYHARKVQERVFNQRLSPEDQQALLKDAQAQIAQFKRYFLCFWIAMFILYIAFAGKHQHLSTSGSRAAVTSIGELITGSTFPFLTFALNNVSLWCIFLCFTVLYLPARDEQTVRKRKRMVRFSAFALSILILSFPLVIFSQTSSIIANSTLVNYLTM
jgi:hypothetical protein